MKKPSKGKPNLEKVRTNAKRCPLLKITKRLKYTEDDKEVEETIEELNDCYKSFCQAWHPEKKYCTYFDVDPNYKEEEDADEEEEVE